MRPGIDAGEQVLFSATRNYENFYLLTGDKTSLRALQNAPKLDAVKQRLAGRILSFEAVLMGLLSKDNFAEHLPGIIAGASCDIALQASFGSDMQTTYDGAIEGLTSHYIALKKETGNLLGEL